MPEPRLMTREEAAEYLHIRPGTFDLWVRQHKMPRAVIGRRWDKKAIDHALDALSGLYDADAETDEDALKREQEELAREAEGWS